MSKVSIQSRNPDRDTRFLLVFLCSSTLLIGLYHEALSCLAALPLLWFLYQQKKSVGLQFYWSAPLLTTIVFSVLYGLSAFWAVDRGMALLGFVKFLCLPLFALAISQLSREHQAVLLDAVPWLGASIALFTGLLSFLPGTERYVLVNGRLAGTLQYPNTFALFLLLGVILLITAPHRPRHWIPCLVVLLLGVAFTGSRTAFVLLALSLLFLCIHTEERMVRYVLLFSGLLLILLTAGYALITGDLSALGRYLTISLESSTLQGRLLYWQDALPVILKHPFGMGYWGYTSTLGSFQTGVYSLTHVHNEVLQVFLDIGWVPAVLFLYTLVRTLCSKSVSAGHKLCITVIFLHSLMDFDLQYPVIWFVLLLCLFSDGTQAKVCTVRKGFAPVCVLLACGCLYFSLVSGLYYTGNYSLCAKLYPGHTQANLKLLQTAASPEELDLYADRILNYNASSALALSAKARTAYANGNFEQVIQYKEKAISLSRYSKEEYLDYFQMLSVGYQLYLQNGDTASAEICRQKLLSIPHMLEEVLLSTSPRAWKITDQPELSLPNEYLAYLDALRSTPKR